MPSLPSRQECSTSCGLLISVHLVLFSAATALAADAQETAAVQWKPQMVRLTADSEHPWWEFPAAITFTHQATGQRLVLEACWDGGRKWLVQFAAPRPGVWTWESTSEDAGLNGAAGRFVVRPPKDEERERNPNYRGHLRISRNGRYFEYADGTPMLLLADTLWSGNTARCGLGENNDGPFFQYLADRKAKGCSAILIKYLNGFDDGPANPTGERNEGGYAFLQRNFERLNSKYFQALDRRLDAIWSHGFVAAIPAAWWGKTGKAVFDIQWAKRVSAYCAVRYGAYNSLWCLSGEYQYAFKDCGWTEESFDDLGRTVQTHNPYNPRTAESAPLADAPTGGAEWPIPQRPSPSDEDWILCVEKRS